MRQAQIVNFEMTLPFALLRMLLLNMESHKRRKIWGNREEFGSRKTINLYNEHVLISLQPP